MYLRTLAPDEEAALPDRPFKKVTLAYVPERVRYRAAFVAPGRYEPLAPPFYDLRDAQRRCEQELQAQHADAPFRWEAFDEPPTTSWQMTAQTSAGAFEELGYWVIILGSDLDDGPQSW
ncbi:hypothetical protein ACIGXA_39920 [Streptomyces fildesensis]|uniref:Uncharacterized protein n=1 Tax=Streptomyces fildesensis TaxID=375757 RepID=A0ABW8CMQ5_9ACTN